MASGPMPTPPLPVHSIAPAAAAPVESADWVGVAAPIGDDAPVEVDSLRLLTGRAVIPGCPVGLFSPLVPGWSRRQLLSSGQGH